MDGIIQVSVTKSQHLIVDEPHISECLQLSDISSIKDPLFMLGTLCHPVSVATSSQTSSDISARWSRSGDIQPCTPELLEKKQIVMLKFTN